jgi:hypothetical protein
MFKAGGCGRSETRLSSVFKNENGVGGGDRRGNGIGSTGWLRGIELSMWLGAVFFFLLAGFEVPVGRRST